MSVNTCLEKGQNCHAHVNGHVNAMNVNGVLTLNHKYEATMSVNMLTLTHTYVNSVNNRGERGVTSPC